MNITSMNNSFNDKNLMQTDITSYSEHEEINSDKVRGEMQDN